MKRGYIWTALTQHIKPGVEGGGRQRPVVLDVRSHRVNTDGERTRPAAWDTLEGGGGAAVCFGSMPGADSDRRQRDESKMRNYFYFHGREDPQSLVAQAVSPEYIPM